VSIACADAFEIGPYLIQRQTHDLIRGAPDRPIGAPSSSARIIISAVAAGNNVSFAHILRRLVIGVVIPSAHRFFVDVEAHIEGPAHGAHEAWSEIDTPLHETRCRSDNGQRLDEAKLVVA